MEANVGAPESCPCESGKERLKCHGGSPIDVRDPDASTSSLCIFGFPAFQEGLFESYKEYFLRTLPSVRSLTFEIVRSVIPDAGVQAAVHALASLAFATHLEVVLLAGNGLGFGALKGVRCILECLFIVEYLVQHPEEAERHTATGDDALWRMLGKGKQHGFDLGRFQPYEGQLQEKHRAARERFRSMQWNLEKIAREIGRQAEYDTIYRPLSEFVHPANLGIGFRAQRIQGTDWPVLGLGASDQGCGLSLLLSHKFLILVFEAVSKLFRLDYSERLATSLSELERASL